MTPTEFFVTDDGARIPRITPSVRPMAPGSPAAVKAGCLCPVTDNCYGRGYRYQLDGRPTNRYVIMEGCPIHRLEYLRAMGAGA